MSGKYNNKKTVIDGITFDSKAEARRYTELKILERAGEISNLEDHVKYELQPKFKRGKKTIQAITYEADFRYIENGAVVLEDVKGGKNGKGTRTQVFDLKAKILQFRFPDIELRIIAA